MKFCPYCGKEIIEGAAFCPFCGKSLATQQQSPAPATSAPTPTQGSIASAPVQINVKDITCKVILKDVGPNRIKVIQYLQKLTGETLDSLNSKLNKMPLYLAQNASYDKAKLYVEQCKKTWRNC